MNFLRQPQALLRSFVFMLLLSLVLPVSAQNSTEEAKPKTEAKQKKNKPKERVFKPSEEISEDLPVPFPIDI